MKHQSSTSLLLLLFLKTIIFLTCQWFFTSLNFPLLVRLQTVDVLPPVPQRPKLLIALLPLSGVKI